MCSGCTIGFWNLSGSGREVQKTHFHFGLKLHKMHYGGKPDLLSDQFVTRNFTSFAPLLPSVPSPSSLLPSSPFPLFLLSPSLTPLLKLQTIWVDTNPHKKAWGAAPSANVFLSKFNARYTTSQSGLALQESIKPWIEKEKQSQGRRQKVRFQTAFKSLSTVNPSQRLRERVPWGWFSHTGCSLIELTPCWRRVFGTA